MVIIMRFYTASHGKFHDRGYSDILYGMKSIDIMGMLNSRTLSNHNYMVIIMYYIYWVSPEWPRRLIYTIYPNKWTELIIILHITYLFASVVLVGILARKRILMVSLQLPYDTFPLPDFHLKLDTPDCPWRKQANDQFCH